MKEAIFHPEAREEMSQSFYFYEARLDGLDLRFLSVVEQTVERISTYPDAGAPVVKATDPKSTPERQFSKTSTRSLAIQANQRS